MGIDIGGFLIGVLCGAFITLIAFIKENRKPKYSKKYDNKKNKSISNIKTEETQEYEKDDLLWQNIKVSKRTSAFDSKAY